MIKSASRSKLLHCFRPIDAAIEHESSDDLSAESGEEMPILISEKKRTFSRAVKAVFFDTALAKRVRSDAKCEKLKSKRTLSNGETSMLLLKKRPSLSSSSSSSSSSRSSSSCCSSDYSEKRKVVHLNQKSEEDSNHHRRKSSIALCFFTIGALAITVLCGKFLAIIFTSICLYAICLSDRRRERDREILSPEEKKMRKAINN